MSYEVIMISLVIAFCLYAVYTDVKHRKISNILTYSLIYAGILYQITLVVIDDMPFYPVVYNILGSLLVMWLLYWYDVLGPGDAKLFCGISMALLPTVFGPSTSLLTFIFLCINIFIPYFLIVGVYLVLKSDHRNKREALKESFRWQGLSKVLIFFVTFLALGHILSFIMVEISRRTGFTFGILPHLLITVLLFRFVRNLVNRGKYSIYIMYAIWLAALSILPFTRMPPDALQKMILRLTILAVLYYGLFTGFLLNLQARMSGRAVNIDELQEGMVPAEQIIRIESDHGGNKQVEYQKMNGFEINRFNPNAIITPKLPGLSKSEIEILKELKMAGCFRAFNNELQIQSTVPFAPVLLLGVILTILFRGPFYVGLLRLFFFS